MMTNFGGFLHERSTGSTVSDAGTASPPQSLRIPSVAASLQNDGLKAGEFVVISCNLTAATATAYLAAIYAGAVAIPVHEQDLPRLLPKIRKLTGVRFLSSQKNEPTGPIAAAARGMKRLTAERSTTAIPPASRRADDLAALMPTSGSTSTPRLVRVSHENLIANTEAIVRSQRLDSNDTALLVLPISYCFGASVVHSHLAAGGNVVFDRRFMFPMKVWRALDEHRCTTFAGVPTVYRTILRHSQLVRRPPASVRRMLQAGGPLDAESIAQIRIAFPDVDFYAMYGATEATARISTLDPQDAVARPQSVGKPLPGLEVRIVAPGTTPEHTLSSGEVGEVCVRGASISSGYYCDEDATDERFRDGWLMTGDLGHFDSEGFLYIDGRLADFVKVRGIRISFREIETQIRGVAGVGDVAACNVPHRTAGEAIGIFVVPSSRSVAELQSRIIAAMPAHWCLAYYQQLDELPKTANGKLDRSALRQLATRAAVEVA